MSDRQCVGESSSVNNQEEHYDADSASEEVVAESSGSYVETFKPTSSMSTSTELDLESCLTEKPTSLLEVEEEEEVEVSLEEEVMEVSTEKDIVDVSSDEEIVETAYIDLNDPAVWPVPLPDTVFFSVIQKGLAHVIKDNSNFPKDNHNHYFRSFYYARILKNNEKQDRRWLVYSCCKGCVFCFDCKLFSTTKAGIANQGICDRKNLSNILRQHENSRDHMSCSLQWSETENRFKTGRTIDSVSQRQINEEKQYWRNVLERLLAITQFLATHNLAFRGHTENLDSIHCGNFIDLVKLLGNFDGVMQKHMKCAASKEIKTHYHGKTIQNELIELMGQNVVKEIVQRVKNNKYYSVILDCTHDLNHIEQMSLILRFVNASGCVEEHFTGFMAVQETTGLDRANNLQQALNILAWV
ncbi:zinc finger MYM-type protein 5-like [Hydra vulgaris]|uniref:zinc finger MYM-type protein 5-like n=1 Tax=Hydra vulgaris TaxID=6087 RepID=UPI001F5F39E8|nr:zinc finger MYM-type protein 5-like [Hydra vulgaris]